MQRVLKDVVISLAGLAGLIAVLWLVASSLLGVSLIVFRTGSMAPSMPTGTAAIVQPIPAAEVVVGDVVTVQRPGEELPVTHRVVSVTPDPATAEGRILELRGDANDVSDQAPYPVTHVQRVVFSVPMLGTAITVARTPIFLGATTLAVAALVVWAFWPSRTDREPTGRRAHALTEIETPPMLHPQLFEVKK